MLDETIDQRNTMREPYIEHDISSKYYVEDFVAKYDSSAQKRSELEQRHGVKLYKWED